MYKADRIAFNKYFDSDLGDNLACRHCGLFHVTPESTQFQKMAAELREYVGRSFPIVSGTRCEVYNKEIGGAIESKHLDGIAFDVAFTTEFYNFNSYRKRYYLINIKDYWEILCNKYGVRGGIGFYNNWFHIDSRPLEPGKRYIAHWDYSNYL